MEFVLKALIGTALMPLSLVVFALALGTISLWFAKGRSVGRWLVTGALGALLLLGYGIPFNRVASALESRYPALLVPDPTTAPRWIVVLGAGVRVQEDFPLSSRLMDDTLYRLVEALRLHRRIVDSKLVFSGGVVLNSPSSAHLSAQAARALGIAAQDIVIEDRGRNTAEEASYIRQLVGDSPFILVTSALHMPRAMQSFEKEGMRPLPAPTQHRIGRSGGSLHPANYFPSVAHIAIAHAAVHEILGTWWARLRTSKAGGAA